MAVTSALGSLLHPLRRRRARVPEKPLRDELLSIERLEERAKALAARLIVDPTLRRSRRDVFPRFAENAKVLREAYLSMADDVHKGEFVTPAAEWLLDNYHLVASEIRDVRQNLPRGYYRELPKLATRELAGEARVYAMAVELIRHSDSRLDRQQLVRFMNSFQAIAPLTIGELWAWPSMLKLALFENLRRLADESLDSRAARRAADSYVAQIDAAGHGRPLPLPPAVHPAFVAQLLQRVREYGPRLSAVRAAVDALLEALGHGPGRGDPGRAPAAGRVAGLRRERHHQPAPVLDSRLEPVLRVGEPGRGRPAARPGRRLRQHGLPEPRSLSRGGRGPGGRQRGEPVARGAAHGRERAPGRRGRPGRARHAHRPSPDRQRPRGPRSRRGVSPALPATHPALRLRAHDRGLSRVDRRC